MPTYTYVSVTRVSPSQGVTFGGTAVTITGTGFDLATGVTFDGITATDIVYVSATTITCTTPAHASGAVTVAVVGVDTLANGFTYAIVVTPLPPIPFRVPVLQDGGLIEVSSWGRWFSTVKERIENPILSGASRIPAESVVGVLNLNTIPQLPASRLTITGPRLVGRAAAGSGDATEIPVLSPLVLTGAGLGFLGAPGGFTQGSVIFAGVSGVFSQDNTHLFWDDTNNRLGIGTNTPTTTLAVTGTAAVTGASMGLIGTNAGTENLFVFNATAGASTFIAKTDGTVTINGLNAFSSSIGLSINAAAGGSWTPVAITASGGSTGAMFIVAASGNVGIGLNTPGARLSIVSSGATPSVLTGSPLQTTVNESTFGAPSVVRLENINAGANAQQGLDVLCGPTAGSFVLARMLVSSAAAADPNVKFGTASNHDLIWTTNNGEFLRLKASAYFLSFGGQTTSFPASKRESANWAFRLGDDSAYTGIIASKLFAGGTNVWWQNSGTTKLQAQNGSGYATLDVGPVQLNATTGLTNKNFYLTGTLNNATPASIYMDVALTGISGTGGQGAYLVPSFSLGANTTDAIGLAIPALSMTLNGFTLTNATALKIENAPTAGTNRRAFWVAAGLSQFDGALRATSLGAFAAGDKYVIVDASGNLHVSALGPAS